jgi:acetyl esterase/lipase
MSAIDRAQQQAVFEANASVRARYSDNPRRGYAAICALTPIAEGVEFMPVSKPDVLGWWATPQSADHAYPILYIHGGGYHFGDAESYRGLLSQIAIRTGCPVLGIDYPLAPEAPFPAAFDAAFKARDWLARRDIDSYALMGDSAGGGLALALLPATTSEMLPASVVVFSPWTDLARTGHSFNDSNVHDPIFRPAYLAGLAVAYLDGADPLDGRASPLYEIPADAPPILIQVGTSELLLDDARRYAEAAVGLGVEVALQRFNGLHHVFQRDAGRLALADFALDEAARFIKAHW